MNTDTLLRYRRPATLGGPADDLYPVFIDLATEPLKMRVHEQFPAASTIQPVYVEPVTIGMKSQLIMVGDPGP